MVNGPDIAEEVKTRASETLRSSIWSYLEVWGRVTRRIVLVVVPENRAHPILGLTRFMHAAVCSDSARARASRDVIGWSARYSCPFSLKGV